MSKTGVWSAAISARPCNAPIFANCKQLVKLDVVAAAELPRQRMERGQLGEALQLIHVGELQAAAEFQLRRLGRSIRQGLQDVDISDLRAAADAQRQRLEL